MSSDLTALWGAVTGTIGTLTSFVLGAYEFWKGRIRIKILFEADRKVFGGETRGYSSKKDYSVITVSNLGQRPVTIVKAGYYYSELNEKGMPKGGVIAASELPKKLEDGEAVTILCLQDGIDWKLAEKVFVESATGQIYILDLNDNSKPKNM
ncbi:MAG TPA: hypothetical protein DDW49_03070 [Deltaproteobacteria bacterium]|nr:hypothetical protein [Deltaproteobacteria bacterium]